jgi:hypothetical protein
MADGQTRMDACDDYVGSAAMSARSPIQEER